MKNCLAKIKELGTGKIIVAFFATLLLIPCIVFLVSRVCFMQHENYFDYEFFARVNYNINLLSEGSLSLIIRSMASSVWAMIIAIIYKLFGCHPLFFCHTIFPFIFILLMIIEYLYLGYRLFSYEKRGNYYTYLSTICFVTVFLFLQYFLVYSSMSPEGGVYVGCWRDCVITGVLLIPLPICTVLRRISSEKKRIRDIVLLAIETIMILCYTASVVVRIHQMDEVTLRSVLNENITISWFFIMAIGFTLLSFGLRQKAITPVVIIVALSLVMLCPLPVGLLISYGFASLVTHDDKNNGWMFLSYGVLGLCVLVLGRVYGGWMNNIYTYEPAENKYKISSTIPDLYEKIRDKDPNAKVIVTADWADEMEMFAPEMKVLSLDGVDETNFADTLQQSDEQWDYILMHRDLSIGEVVLYENGFIIEEVTDDAIILKRYQ